MNLQLYHPNYTFRSLLVIEPVFHSSRRSARGRRPVRLPAEEAGQGSEVLRLRGLSDGQAGRPHGQRWAATLLLVTLVSMFISRPHPRAGPAHRRGAPHPRQCARQEELHHPG